MNVHFWAAQLSVLPVVPHVRFCLDKELNSCVSSQVFLTSPSICSTTAVWPWGKGRTAASLPIISTCFHIYYFLSSLLSLCGQGKLNRFKNIFALQIEKLRHREVDWLVGKSEMEASVLALGWHSYSLHKVSRWAKHTREREADQPPTSLSLYSLISADAFKNL